MLDAGLGAAYRQLTRRGRRANSVDSAPGARLLSAARDRDPTHCRDTGDRATELITPLPRLRKYFASYTRITDRTPEMMSGMASLEQIDFSSCAGLTDAGVAKLARLPRLAELRLSGMPGVTGAVRIAFGAAVRVVVDDTG